MNLAHLFTEKYKHIKKNMKKDPLLNTCNSCNISIANLMLILYPSKFTAVFFLISLK